MLCSSAAWVNIVSIQQFHKLNHNKLSQAPPAPSPQTTSWPGWRRSCQSGLCRGTRQPVGVDWLLLNPLWETRAQHMKELKQQQWNINPLGVSQTPGLQHYDQTRELWDVFSLHRLKCNTVAQWLALLSYSKKVVGSILSVVGLHVLPISVCVVCRFSSGYWN